MRFTRLGKRAIAVSAVAIAAAALTAAPADAHAKAGTRSLAAVLTADKSGFDRNGRDFDILTAAVLAVLKAKPASPVGVLADGTKPLTAFIPTDAAFERLVADLQGTKKLPGEKAAFTAVAGLGIDTVETVLLYHVVPGATITKAQARKADGAALTTAQGGTITVRVPFRRAPLVVLVDQDPDDRNPFVVRFNLNKGNPQIAHGVSRVLRPVDL
jgi:uncharacterized surface protein with fasciclin (FAS1) repeats